MAEKLKIIDTYNFQLPDLCDMQQEYKRFTDAAINKYLEVEVDVSHGGYVNKNYYYYEPDGQAKGALSFVTPFHKPIMAEHVLHGVPVGRTVAVAYIPLMVDPSKKNDLTTPKSKIRVKGVISDPSAIDYILTRRYLTVSIGGAPKEPPTCSICGAPVEQGAFGISTSCEHARGKEYDGKLCYWKIGEMAYDEWSFVSAPADAGESHYAGIVGMRWVDNPEPSDSVITIDKNANVATVHDSPVMDKQQSGDSVVVNSQETHKNQDGGSPMSAPKVVDIEWLTLTALAVMDECSDCGSDDDIVQQWTEAKDVDIAAELDKLYDKVCAMVIGDAEISPEKRKAMKNSTFCGPNRTFPVPDCKHAATAMAMLNFPAVKAKYSASVRARIASCVRSKARAMNCPMAKKSDTVVEPVEWKDEAEIAKVNDFEKDFDLSVAQILDTKLPDTETRKNLSDEVFCGPNRTIPVIDKQVAAVAIAMLSWPVIKAKYGDEFISKLSIAVKDRAMRLGIKMEVNTEDKQSAADEVANLQASIATLTAQLADLKTKLQEKDALIEQSGKKIEDMMKRTKRLLAEKVVDLSILTNRPTVSDIMMATDTVKRSEAYKAHVDALLERTEQSLQDTIVDLGADVKVHIDAARVTDPHLNDKAVVKNEVVNATDVKKEEKVKTKKSASELLFGPKSN